MKGKPKYWYFVGISSFSITLGLLIGASRTPVVGVFITGILGLVVGIAGLIFKKKEESEKQTATLDTNATGITLFLISVLLIAGVYLGAQYRAGLYKEDKKVVTDFIWTEENAPKSIYEALDWIMVGELLSKKGYPKSKIQELYLLRKKQVDSLRADSLNVYSYDNYDPKYPFYKTLIQKIDDNTVKDEEMPAPPPPPSDRVDEKQ